MWKPGGVRFYSETRNALAARTRLCYSSRSMTNDIHDILKEISLLPLRKGGAVTLKSEIVRAILDYIDELEDERKAPVSLGTSEPSSKYRYAFPNKHN